MEVSLIYALDKANGIGYKGGLPWHLPADLANFKKLTSGHHIIMGRGTYQSLPGVLPSRPHLVITSHDLDQIPNGVHIFPNLGEALQFAKEAGETEAFIIGGAGLYPEALALAGTFYLTKVHGIFQADTFLPCLDLFQWHLVDTRSYPANEKNVHAYSFEVWKRRDEPL